MILRSIPELYLQHDEALGVLRLEWVAGSNLHKLRNVAAQLLALIQTSVVHHLLIDMNTVPDLPVTDQMWLGDHWMPSLVVSPIERLVLVIASTKVHNQLAVDSLHDLVQPAIRFDAQYFSDQKTGLQWLTDDSERLPLLEAEWNTRHLSGVGSIERKTTAFSPQITS